MQLFAKKLTEQKVKKYAVFAGLLNNDLKPTFIKVYKTSLYTFINNTIPMFVCILGTV